ncbi:DedD protein [Pseudomonas duriflava]|uniref:DedD protein n=1 Tax=Pseudomonas duriflava TaxID=459528 RepID=A0A562Q8M0_9PSED|nr:SPOR domain-containing protein [Pseudomonas duriflava]TWI53092.1 DedD protein [Pseudomonas duriflava]
MDRVLKQRIVGAVVLIALAIVFVPMLFTRQDETRSVVVEPTPQPVVPAMPDVEVKPVETPEVIPDKPENSTALPSTPIAAVPEVATSTAMPSATTPPPAPSATPVPSVPAQPEQRLDSNNLPVSWSVQLASLSNKTRANELQNTLRAQGYNAYVRSVDGMNRVFVGPVVDRQEADRLREQLNKQHKVSGFVVRFQPERG